MAKSFSVANPAHMASVIQAKLFNGNTITSLTSVKEDEILSNQPQALTTKHSQKNLFLQPSGSKSRLHEVSPKSSFASPRTKERLYSDRARA